VRADFQSISNRLKAALKNFDVGGLPDIKDLDQVALYTEKLLRL
jgi:hypothetical protein